MPITLNHKRGEFQTVQQVDFGTGDILIMAARDLDKSTDNQLWLVQHEPKDKDRWDKMDDPTYAPGTETDDMPAVPTVVLAFSDRDSITSLIRSLNELYHKMPAAEGAISINANTPYLTEEGFVFIDQANKPYWIAMYGGNAWMFYWHPDNSWVTLRKVNQNEVFQASQARLPAEKANLYHELHQKHMSGISDILSEMAKTGHTELLVPSDKNKDDTDSQ